MSYVSYMSYMSPCFTSSGATSSIVFTDQYEWCLFLSLSSDKDKAVPVKIVILEWSLGDMVM